MPDRWAPLQKLLEAGVSQGVFTAAVALAGLKGELRWQGAAGFLSRRSGRRGRDPGHGLRPGLPDETPGDNPGPDGPGGPGAARFSRLAGRGSPSRMDTAGQASPAPKEPPHPPRRAAGLAAFLPRGAGCPASARPTLLERLAAATPLEYPPDTATLYSDLGFMLLKAVVERVSGKNLDRFCRKEIYRPLGLKTLGFIPLPRPAQTVPTTKNQKPKTKNRFYAATEPGLIPGRPPAGEVHDENAWAAGGVAGHAGLFGPGREVFRLVAGLYRAYRGEQVGPLTPAAVQHFLTVPPGADRACGFDIPGPDPATRAAGRYFSPRSVGHLGFTGTSFWLDLETGQMVVLLTNRVHLGRNDKIRIAAFRPRFHEAASRALGF